MNALGNLLEKSGGNLLVRGVLGEVDGDQELRGLGVDITDINTTLIGEENPVTLYIALISLNQHSKSSGRMTVECCRVQVSWGKWSGRAGVKTLLS